MQATFKDSQQVFAVMNSQNEVCNLSKKTARAACYIQPVIVILPHCQ